MTIGFRWYGQNNDPVSLDYIKHIPGVREIVWTLHRKPVGDVWSESEIMQEIHQITNAGFSYGVVESLTVHEDIKLGKPSKDIYLENYRKSIRNLAQCGVKVITYNFMPVFDWTRTDLFRKLEDGSNALFFENKIIDSTPPREIFNVIRKGAGNRTMPGWEPEKLDRIEVLLEEYSRITKEQLWYNLKYFLEQIIPTAREYNVKMAIHPDDPPWEIFGLPRLIINQENIKRFLSLVDNAHNGLALCTGSLGANPNNDLPAMIREFAERIHFVHVRNVRVSANGDFTEVSHREQDGTVPIVDVIQTLKNIGFNGCIRPDHGRHIWGEEKHCRPGYGLYDRALGIMYILGVWDALNKKHEKKTINEDRSKR